MRVGYVRVRVSMTHRATCEIGTHNSSQNKKNRAAIEAFKLRRDSGVCKKVQLGMCGSATWRQVH